MSEDNQSNHFIAIDVETANADISSICQIGIVEFQDGKIINQWETLVNPNARFDAKNISIHGIYFDMVKDAPKFPEDHGKIQEWVKDKIVVTHTPFDQKSLNSASQKYGLPEILCSWIDSARVVRQQWEQFSQSGYGLPNITEHLGITYKAHSAMEDARAAGEIVLKAMEQSGNPLKKYIKRIHKSKVIVKEIEQIVKFQSSYIEPYPLKVSDVSFYQKSIENIAMFTGDDEGVNQDDFIAHLILENTNYDPNAVRVEIDNKKVGYLPKRAAKTYRKKLIELNLNNVIGECYASVKGGHIIHREYGSDIQAQIGIRLDLEVSELQIRVETPVISKPIILAPMSDNQEQVTIFTIPNPPKPIKKLPPMKPTSRKRLNNKTIFFIVVLAISIIVIFCFCFLAILSGGKLQI